MHAHCNLGSTKERGCFLQQNLTTSRYIILKGIYYLEITNEVIIFMYLCIYLALPMVANIILEKHLVLGNSHYNIDES